MTNFECDTLANIMKMAGNEFYQYDLEHWSKIYWSDYFSNCTMNKKSSGFEVVY